MKLKIFDTDRFFSDSPNTGDPDCICSRCHERISEEQVPFRMVVDQKSFENNGEPIKDAPGYVNGTEFRLCEPCMKKYL